MTNILAISAKKGGGKTTATNFLFGLEMLSLSDPKLIDYFRIDNEGRLVVPGKFDNETKDAIFDPITPLNQEMLEFLEGYIWPYIKQYNFADYLKQDVCIKILGLTWEQCYGSDDDKNTKTYLLWENMPGVVTTKKPVVANQKEAREKLGKYYDIIDGLVYHEPGQMTAREVMQFVGSDIFRKMYGQVWVESCIRRIELEQPAIALIGDCRFPNEVDGVQKAGGKVIRFTRNPHPEDSHVSETALDEDKFDWSKFDSILDNKNMSIHEQNLSLYEIINKWNWFEYKLENNESLKYGVSK